MHDPQEWPEVSRIPAELPELPPRPTPLDLARAYASVVFTWLHQWPRMVDALEWIHGAWLANDARLQRLEETLAGRIQATYERRHKLPSLTEYNPELTPHGGIKLDPRMWQEIQNRMAAIEIEKARADGAEAERARIERASAARWRSASRWIKILSPIVIAIAGGVGFLIRHLLP